MRYRLLQANIGKIAQQLDSIQTKIATQKEINKPSDDPIKFATSIQYHTEMSNCEQYNNNLQRLNTLVGMYDTCFDKIGDQLSSVFQAAKSYGTMSDDLRLAASEQIKATIEQFVTIANSKLGSTYIFGGQQADAAPFRLNSDYSVTYNVSQGAEDATGIYVDCGQLGQFGVSGRGAFYSTEKIAFGSVSNQYAGDIYSDTDSFAYAVGTTNDGFLLNGSALALTQGIYTGSTLAQEMERQLGNLFVVNEANNAIYVGGNRITLDSGTYTGATLASEIQTKLGAADYSVSYDESTRKFTVTKTTGGDATFNWSQAGATAGSLLGFNNVDAVVTGGGGSNTSDVAKIQFSVAYDRTTRKFLITNNTGGDATFNWSQAGATAGSLLGFNNVDAVVTAGTTEKSDYDTGRKSFLIKITGPGSTTGALASRAQYSYSTDGGVTYQAAAAVSTGGADTTAGDIIITSGSNDTISFTDAVGTHTVQLGGMGGVAYTGAAMATEIENALDPSHTGSYSVSYNAETRKFSITNNTGSVVTFNWTHSTAAGVLGFANVDTVLGSGNSDSSDYDAGMFIDGAGVVNERNNGIKFAFSVRSTDFLSTTDTFSVKDLSIFELLKNLKDAFDSDDSTWVSKNVQYIEKARSLTTTNNAVIAFQGTQANNLIDNNKTKTNKFQAMNSELVNADMADLAIQFNTLLNTYQALLSTLARVQSVSILDYLKL
jgi:flagellin-like hook-associated protein FlgL